LLFCFLGPVAAGPDEDHHLDEIMEREWKRLNDEQPILAIYLGEPTRRSWPDNSATSRRARADHYRQVLQELADLKDSDLSDAQQINRRLFAQQLSWQVSLYDHKLDLFSMNQREGLHTLATLSSSIDFQDRDDLREWVERLESFAEYADGEIRLLEEAIQNERVQPRIISERILERVQAQVPLHRQAQDSPFYEPFAKAPQSLRESPDFKSLDQRAQVAIESQVGPAFQRLEAFLSGPYLEASPKEVGLSRLPGGAQAYEFLVERYTTTDLTPDDIHELGLREVERIRAEMNRIKEEVGFRGTLEELFSSLRHDPEHYVDDPEELLRRYRSFCKRVDGQMPNLFKTLPRKPYGVEPIPDYIAPATTTAYYLPGSGHLSGTYFVNLYQPETRALFEIPALSLHESVPGHHHQIALAQELPSLPAFRRESAGFGDYTVFVEGWALYAESLGEEMGLYSDPYDKLGRYTYEMWRAIRLVLDTGLHTKNWTRAQAISYFLANSPRSELDITNEVDRYISWPGQALAYKMGELEIKRLRALAEEELKESFDIREFHDVVLNQGAVPLQQLERQVTDYISEKRRDS